MTDKCALSTANSAEKLVCFLIRMAENVEKNEEKQFFSFSFKTFHTEKRAKNWEIRNVTCCSIFGRSIASLLRIAGVVVQNLRNGS